MPNPGPETYRFSAYIHYEDGDPSKPRVTAYWNKDGAEPTPEEVGALQKHAEAEDPAFTFAVTRTVTENQFKQSQKGFRISLAGGDTTAARSAIDYLKQVHPSEFEDFARRCWESAWAKLSKHFPQCWPKSNTSHD